MSDKLILTLDTGAVTIETYPDKAPEHVARIKELADEGFYDGIPLHRVIDGFMAQMGCPKGDGTGGSKKPNLKAEFNDVSHQRAPRTRTAPTASSSSASTTPPSSTASTRSGARWSTAWSMWTPPRRASRRAIRPRS